MLVLDPRNKIVSPNPAAQEILGIPKNRSMGCPIQDFLTQLARDVLNGPKLADLQTLFADEMQVSSSPLGCPMETSLLLVPYLPASQTWEEWLRKHSIWPGFH